MDTQDTRIPVTLLTGFLGAGKTTLLNHLINDPEAGRIAVIMNEFGAAGLDHDLIEASTEETILMQSGCLCCTFRGDIAKTLGKLMARKQNGELSFDRIVIETTGIAEPAPIVHTLVVDQLMPHYYRMDGIVTVADAATGACTLETQTEAVNQLALADLIVVTKTDLVSKADLASYEAQVSTINNSTQRIYADHGKVPTGALFGLSALREDVANEDIEAWLGKAEKPQSHHHGSHDHHHGHDHDSHHGKQIRSASIELSDPIPASVFDFWLDMLIAIKGPDLLRIKGIVHVEGMDWPFVFHGVQHIFDTPVPLKSWNGQDTTSRVVVIARNMSQDDLNASLNVLRMKPKEVETTTDGMIHETVEMPF
ncbi:MAG: GTP-binding protein [Tateyamaria sp.]|jgi:G3E family GTPase|uniref:CobW family GTP-binding protein n=1 Tax=Tateyamaria sp. TaxID=1929288 RepID=UPI0032DD861F